MDQYGSRGIVYTLTDMSLVESLMSHRKISIRDLSITRVCWISLSYAMH